MRLKEVHPELKQRIVFCKAWTLPLLDGLLFVVCFKEKWRYSVSMMSRSSEDFDLRVEDETTGLPLGGWTLSFTAENERESKLFSTGTVLYMEEKEDNYIYLLPVGATSTRGDRHDFW